MKPFYYYFRITSRKIFFLIALFIGAGLFAQTPVNINAPGSQIPEEINIGEPNNLSILKLAKRARPFVLNPEVKNHSGLKKGDEIQLDLFRNKNFTAVIKRKTTDINGVTSMALKLKNYKHAHAIISISEDSYLVTVDIPSLGERYATRMKRNTSEAYLIEIDKNTLEDTACGNTNIELKSSKNSIEKIQDFQNLVDPSETCLSLPTTSDPAIIDILVVYTPAADAWASSNDGSINNTIASAITQANEISINNSLGILFQLVHSAQIDYTEVSAGTDLRALQSSTDTGPNSINEVHDLRKTYNADLVSMFTDLTGDGIGGIANLCNSRYGKPNEGFSNVKVRNANSIYTFIHELSHNMGASHYYDQNSAPGPTDWIDWPENTWSSGYRDQETGTAGGDFRTIMTYSDGLPGPVIPYLSDPSITYTGSPESDDPLGDVIGNAATANNARTLLEMKHEVARYSEYAQYCLAGEERRVGQNVYYISNVSMGDINHSSIGSFYSDLSGLATCMDPGDTQTVTTSIVGASPSAYLAVWIDWNDDKIFDSSELEYQSVPGISEHSFNITAPLGYSAGEKRMRIRTYSTGSGSDPDWIPGNLDPCGFFTVGEVEDYTIKLGEPTPCAIGEIPTNFSIDNIQNTTINLSWDPQSGVDYYDLRYKKITDQTWTDISNVVYPFYELSDFDQFTDYEVQIRSICSGSPSAFSSSLIFTTGLLDYCESSMASAENVYISRVEFNTLNNSSTNENGGYSDFTNLETSVEIENTYTLTIERETTTNSGLSYGVYIDFNGNGIFDLPDEQVVAELGASNPYSSDILIPQDAVTGKTLMRVTGINAFAVPQPCGVYGNSGEVEDYILNIIESCASPTDYYVDDDGDTYGDINDPGTSFCSDPGTGWSLTNDDCNDSEDTVYPNAPELCDGQINNCNTTSLPENEIDNDSDGYIECTIDSGGWDGVGSVIGGGDCNDADPTVYPGAPELCDGQINDCDINTLASTEIDNDGDGYVECDIDANGWDGDPSVIGGGDCNDDPNNGGAAINPGATEVCDGVDNDCDGDTDEDGDTLYYVDNDEDTYGDSSDTGTFFCSDPGTGWSLTNDDCNDNNPAINPGATEVCDGVDNDCDGDTDEDGDTLYYVDNDEDTYGDSSDTGTFFCSDPGTGWSLTNDDCNDNNPAINPGATEVCDGVDNDCDGDTDEDGDTLYYVDNDEDTYGDSSDTGTFFCSDPGTGWSLTNDDCNDNNPAINPGATEVCDGVDNDCDGDTDEDGDTLYYVDNDEDTYGDSSDTGTFFCSDPGTGWSLTNDDCNDNNPAINPGATEVCDGVDNDCDGDTDEDGDTLYYVDNDEDTYGDSSDTGTFFCSDPGTGWSLTNDDCNDNNPAINPGATEVCDGVDNDCDGDTDEDGDTLYYVDNDEDTYGDSSDTGTFFCSDPGTGWSLTNDDCNDNNPAINPGATEVCDGVDNDCDGDTDEDGDTLYYVDNDEDTYGDSSDTGTFFCSDPGTGWSLTNDDCNDNNPAINPGATEVCDGVDNDCDGDTDEDGDTLYYVDNDEDTYGDSSDTGTFFCSDPGTGWSLTNDDCNDNNPAVNPGEEEILNNGKDDDCNPDTPDTIIGNDSDEDGILDDVDNCIDIPNPLQENNDGDSLGDACDPDDDNDGVLDEVDCAPFDPNIGVATIVYYIDDDKDGYGDISDSGETFCTDPGLDYSLNNTDCNDSDDTIYPGAFDERGDGIDQDCDGTDEPLGCIGTDVLTIMEVCTEDPSTTRGWLITNPADCAVEVLWVVRKYRSEGGEGMLVAKPGEHYFETPALPKGATQVVIYWKDSKGKAKKRTLASVGCSSTSLNLTATLSIQELTAYPNPLESEGLWLEFSQRQQDENFKVRVYDLYGRELEETSISVSKDGGKYFWPLDHSGWEQGIYILRVKSATQEYQIKLVK